MPRLRNLTWTPGSDGRRGRWRKKYRGKSYYFDGGRGKSDEAAYQAALTEWNKIKSRIDADAPTPHYVAFEAAIEQWEEVRACAQRHDDFEMNDAAVEKIGVLRRHQKLSSRKPPRREDLFENFFELEVRRPKFAAAYKEFGKLIDAVGYGGDAGCDPEMLAARHVTRRLSEMPRRKSQELIVPSQAMFQPDALTTESIVWRDRLNVMRRQSIDHEQMIKFQVDRFLEQKGIKASAGQLSLGRRRTVEIHLNAFVEWIGNGTGVGEITSQKLLDYRDELLGRVTSGEWSSSTASERLVSLKSFLRWLYQTEVILTLPRVMDAGSHALEIGKARSVIEIFTKPEIAKLLSSASPRTRLYILLTLNTSMTQKDIADLSFDEVDFKGGRISRKRSKTRKYDSTPLVNYKLWPETLALLESEKNSDRAGRVLVNAKGGSLWSETDDPTRGYQKIDNVRSAFERLRRKVGIEKSFISLKKTAATELAGSKEFSSVRGLFLGHAPTTVADQHYAKAPGQLLDEAISWLRDRFEIPTIFSR